MFRRNTKREIGRLALALLSLFLLVSSASAADRWISVRSKNFYLIGDAGEKDLRGVATRLEQFRATFRLLFPHVDFKGSVDTNVIVFKDDKAYRPFKPRTADGKADDWIAGYFQSGEDVNYITLSAEGKDEDTYGTIFHEYVHFMVDTRFGKAQVPPWFNEGLAEYYQTFDIENDQKVYLGKLQQGHLRLLQNAKLIPFDQFFNIDNYSLHQNGHDSRSLFYAQAWALIHYLIQSGQSQNLSKFLSLVLDDVKPETAFRRAFGLGYKDMEEALRKYIRQRKFQISWIKFDEKLTYDSSLTVSPLSNADANAYLGDLLYHTREYDDAERYLKLALSEDPDQTLANTAYGLVLMRRTRFDEAKKYLEKAVATNRKNHFAQYSYAYLLSREAMDEFGYVSSIPDETARKMRTALRAAIETKPSFVPAYRLMAFINLVNNEDLEGALGFLRKGLAIQPGNLELTLMTAKILLRQEKYDEAEKIAARVAAAADTEQIRREARGVERTVSEFRKSVERMKQGMAGLGEGTGTPILRKRSELTAEDIEEINRENLVNRLHAELPKTRPGENRVIGRLEKITCSGGKAHFAFRTENGLLNLESKDFSSLYLLILDEDAGPMQVGCESDLSESLIVLTYRKAAAAAGVDGTLKTMTFVPEFFRLKTPEEIAKARPILIVEDTPTSSPGAAGPIEKESMLEALRKALRTPEPGEVREIGTLQKIECGRQFSTYRIDSKGRHLSLRSDPQTPIRIVTFTRDLDGAEFRCGSGPYTARAVVTYRPGSDKKVNGTIVALEFVPDSFEL